MRIDGIDHFVLTVRDIEATCAFYSQILGMQIVTFGDGRKALRFGDQKINLHQSGNEFEPKAQHPTVGASDFCLITTVPLAQVLDHIRSFGLDVVEGPINTVGALGPIESIYFYDPDGNLLEVANYLDHDRIQL